MPGGNKIIFRRALSETSTTASDLGTPGEIRYDTAGNKYRLVYLVGSCIHGGVLQYNSLSGNDGYSVLANAQTVIRPAGVQNQALTSLTTGVYCWAQVAGMGSVSVLASYAANLNLAVSTAGLVSIAGNHATAVGRWVGHTVQSVTTGVQKVRFNMEP